MRKRVGFRACARSQLLRCRTARPTLAPNRRYGLNSEASRRALFSFHLSRSEEEASERGPLFSPQTERLLAVTFVASPRREAGQYIIHVEQRNRRLLDSEYK